MALFSKDLGVDLGTMYTRVAEDSQVLLSQPSVVAVNLAEEMMIEIGEEALNMMGRVDEESIQVTRTLTNGVVAYYRYTEILIQEMIKRAVGQRRLFSPRVMITHPYGITSVEHRAVQEAALASSSEAHLISQPLAAALGMDMPVSTPSGNMIVILGGGCSQAAVMAMYDIVSGETLREGGLNLDDAIISYVRKKYGLIIAQPTAEQVKLRIGAAVPQDDELSMELQGQDQVTGLPRPLTLTTGEIVEAVEEPLDRVFEMVRQVLERTPPELASDIIDRGIALCGGGALLRGVDKLMTQKLGVPTYLVDNPITCIAEGSTRAFDLLKILQRTNTGTY